MKSFKIALVILIMALFTVSAAWCDVADDLLQIDAELAAIAAAGDESATAREDALKKQENELFALLLASEEKAAGFLDRVAAVAPELTARFLARLRFEVVHEGRVDLGALLDKWLGNENSASRTKKKVAFIYGCEVNLLDGEWHNAPDGRRFWISNEFPDIILSPAEYQRYAKTAAVIEE
jgi:hypothetical protein